MIRANRFAGVALRIARATKVPNNPSAHKSKRSTSGPPPPGPKIPPPNSKPGALWAWRLSSTNRQKIPGVDNVVAAISGPKIEGKNCDPSRHLQESPDPPGPKSQKSLQKGPFGGPQKSLKKYPEKSKNTDFWTFLGIFRLFRVFFGTFLRTPKKTFFETFLRFRAWRVRRLL